MILSLIVEKNEKILNFITNYLEDCSESTRENIFKLSFWKEMKFFKKYYNNLNWCGDINSGLECGIADIHKLLISDAIYREDLLEFEKRLPTLKRNL